MTESIPFSLNEDVKKKIRHITLFTKRQLRGMLVGDVRSAQKGVGFEFDQIREYYLGDDVRFIDWNATSRMNTLLIKQYREERSRTIILAVDVSGSSQFGSTTKTKREQCDEIAAVLAYVAGHGNDLVGLILFSDTIELYIPPKNGFSHVFRIMNEIFSFKPKKIKTTHFKPLYEHLLKINKKNALLFTISDFIAEDIELKLKTVSRLYDMISIRILDPNEREIKNVGLLTIEDMETGETIFVDAQTMMNRFFKERMQQQNAYFAKYGIDTVDVTENRCAITEMITLFKRRMHY